MIERTKPRLLKMQVEMAKARWVELRKRYESSPKVSIRARTIRTSGREGEMFSMYRIAGLSYRAVGEAVGLSAARVRTLVHLLEREFFRRCSVPVFHGLYGEEWSAHNCVREHDERYSPQSAHTHDCGWVFRYSPVGGYDQYPYTLRPAQPAI